MGRAILFGVALGAAVACSGEPRPDPLDGSSDGTPGKDATGEDANPDGDEGTGGDSSSGGAAHSGGATSHDSFGITFDYSLDHNGFFDAPERRAALTAAAQVWSVHLLDDFDPLPAGATVHLTDPSDPFLPSFDLTLETEVDDVRIFVGCATDLATQAHASVDTGFLADDDPYQAALGERYAGDDYEPWVVSISFGCDVPWFYDPTPASADDIPDGQFDFLGVAGHELGHALGIASWVPAFERLSDGDQFTGPLAVAAHGGAVPVDGDGHPEPEVGQLLTLSITPRGVREPAAVDSPYSATSATSWRLRLHSSAHLPSEPASKMPSISAALSAPL